MSNAPKPLKNPKTHTTKLPDGYEITRQTSEPAHITLEKLQEYRLALWQLRFSQTISNPILVGWMDIPENTETSDD